ncbi:hypothetical protein VST7929_02656 [Vibrio stylophorae]|uniref:Glycosyltransferase 2-like domain-containing protein n=1 Tax=Vibrio stylophorae TaxID=659351 RepID=A0ABM8ZWI7_9VIBR|nr:glycosyltransferase [Vibrio stylophorae]CAH0534706.1 hypothetical protein VST7929_02656 [Vibrio stylophorae]
MLDKIITEIPKVAVIVGCYNHRDYIIECIQSILEQNYSNLVVYVSDDCSTDDSFDVLSDFVLNHKIINVYLNRNANNLGVADNYNLLIDKALQDNDVAYVVPFAGDDIMCRNKIKRQVDSLSSKPEVLVSYSNMEWFDSKTRKKIINHFNFFFRASTQVGEIISESLIPTPTLCIRRSGVEKIKYDNRLKYINDYLFTVELVLSGGVVYIPEVLVLYRKHGTSITDLNTFADERVLAATIVSSKYGYKKFTDEFASTALYDDLLSHMNNGDVRSSLLAFKKVGFKFFSSRKWFFRLLKFFYIVLNRKSRI